MACIYLIEFPKHPELFYVGKTKRFPVSKRVYEHKNSQYKNYTDNLCNWYRKNKIKYTFCILEECSSVEEMDIAESFYIKYLRWLGVNLTNHYDGTTNSTSWTDERRKKHSEFRHSHKFSDETKLKMSESKLGMEVTWGDKISKGKKGVPNPFSETHLVNIQAARKLSHGHAVVQMDLDGNEIQSFNMIIDASQYLIDVCNSKLTWNGLKNGIKDCCTGRQLTAAGYKWKYKD